EQEAACTCAESVVHVLVEVEGGQHEHSRASVAIARELAGGLDAVEAGHAYVHQHDVGVLGPADAHGLFSVGGGSGDRQVRLGGEGRGESLAHDLLVVGDDYADAHVGCSLVGRSARTAKPPPVAGPARGGPPPPSARSRMPTMPCPFASATAPGPLSRTSRWSVSVS